MACGHFSGIEGGGFVWRPAKGAAFAGAEALAKRVEAVDFAWRGVGSQAA
jgi:hypothetical protein